MDLMEIDDENDEEQPALVVQGIADVMAVSVDWMGIRDYIVFGSINRHLRELSFQYVKQLTHKICITTEIEYYSTIRLILFAKNGRQVLYKIACRDEIIEILKYLLHAQVYPFELDVQGYNHGEGDAIMEWLHEFRSFRKVTMTQNCSCSSDCIGLGRLPLQDIYHITPCAFLENKQSVNSLHIHACLPSKCVDQLTVMHSYNFSATEIFEKFKDTVKMMVRCLYIQGVNRFYIARNYLEALVNIMKVEELHLQCEAHDFYSPRCADLKFSFKWENKSLISVKKLFYTAADKIESSTVIIGLSSLFEAKDEMNIEFPSYRSTEDLLNTMDTLSRNLNRVETSNLVLSYTCQLSDENPNYEKACGKIAPFFRREGFTVIVAEQDRENRSFYTLEAICQKMHVKISINFLEPPPPLPAPSIQERRAHRVQWQLIPNHNDHRGFNEADFAFPQ